MNSVSPASRPSFSPFAAVLALMPGQRVAGSERWPVADAVIVESSVSARRDGGRQRFLPVLSYRYDVDGQRFEGSRITWSTGRGFRKYTRARRQLDRYRPGSTVKVHYDPARPGSAVLEPGSAPAIQPAQVIACMVALCTAFTIGIAIAAN